MPLRLRRLVIVGSTLCVGDDHPASVVAPLAPLDEFEHRVDVVPPLGQQAAVGALGDAELALDLAGREVACQAKPKYVPPPRV